MPSFTHKDSLNYWQKYKDPTIYRVLIFMEALENWTIDNTEQGKKNKILEKSLEKLGKSLDNIGKVELEKHDQLIKAIAYLKASRTLRILHCLDTAQPGNASQLISYAEENTESTQDAEGLFLRRNVIFERLRLIPKIFSKERFVLIQSILEEDDEDSE